MEGRKKRMLRLQSLTCTGFWLRLLAPLALFLVALGWAPFSALGEEDEVPFSPRKDAEEVLLTRKKKPEAGAPRHTRREFSFIRYEGAFRHLCDAMALDGRKERLVDLGRKAFDRENDSLACKALWRTIVAGCSPRAKPKPPRAAPRTSPTQEQAPAETPVPPGYPAGERLPSIEVVEQASALSIRMHKDEPEEEPSLLALRQVLSQLTQDPSLSPAEIDYYSALSEYLCSAWSNR